MRGGPDKAAPRLPEGNPAMTITVARLHRCGLVALTADVFGQRHCRREIPPVATTADVIAAHHALNLIDQPWPTREQAPALVKAVQSQLDRMLLQ